MSPTPLRHLRLVCLAGALVMVACSDNAGPSAGGSLTTAQTADIGDASFDESEQAMEAFDVNVAVNPAAEAVPAPVAGAAAFDPPQANCATVSSTADTDGDGVRDSTVFTYALPACSFTGVRGGRLDLTGLATVTDPSPNAPDWAYKLELEDLTFALTAPSGETPFTAIRNGTRNLSANSAGLALSNQITTVRKVGGRPDATIVHNLLLTFTPAQGTSLVRGQPLPNGEIVLAGTIDWTRGGENRNFTVSTVTPLQYDASCDAPRGRRITAGQIHWILPSGGHIETVWTACGQRPTHTFVPAAAS